MRLIDADELIKDRVENDPVRIAVKCAPTAFDREDECDDTQNVSMAGKLIRAQGEQVRRMSAEEYLKDKSRETVKRNRGLLSKISTEADGKEKWSK